MDPVTDLDGGTKEIDIAKRSQISPASSQTTPMSSSKNTTHWSSLGKRPKEGELKVIHEMAMQICEIARAIEKRTEQQAEFASALWCEVNKLEGNDENELNAAYDHSMDNERLTRSFFTKTQKMCEGWMKIC